MVSNPGRGGLLGSVEGCFELCWGDVAGYCRAAIRGRYGPAYRDDDLGFRVAAVPLGGAGKKNKKNQDLRKAEPAAEPRSEARR